MHSLSKLTEKDPSTANLIAEQLLDNSLLAAGLLEDPQTLIARNLKLMEALAAKG
jgi:molecular chaperone HtpG